MQYFQVPKMSGEIFVPRVFHDLTTRRVLVTEWVEGEKLAQSPPEVINKLTKIGVKCFLAQMLVRNLMTERDKVEGRCSHHTYRAQDKPPFSLLKNTSQRVLTIQEMGYFHSDPHPGNLLVTPSGQLALIDFGLCAAVPLPDTRNMTLAIVHLMQGDVRGLVEDAIELGFLPDDSEADALVAGEQDKEAAVLTEGIVSETH